MFKIIALVIILATGQVVPMQSNKSFDTKEACEAARPAMEAQLVKEVTAQVGAVQVETKCDNGRPA